MVARALVLEQPDRDRGDRLFRRCHLCCSEEDEVSANGREQRAAFRGRRCGAERAEPLRSNESCLL